ERIGRSEVVGGMVELSEAFAQFLCPLDILLRPPFVAGLGAEESSDAGNRSSRVPRRRSQIVLDDRGGLSGSAGQKESPPEKIRHERRVEFPGNLADNPQPLFILPFVNEHLTHPALRQPVPRVAREHLPEL